MSIRIINNTNPYCDVESITIGFVTEKFIKRPYGVDDKFPGTGNGVKGSTQNVCIE